MEERSTQPQPISRPISSSYNTNLPVFPGQPSRESISDDLLSDFDIDEKDDESREFLGSLIVDCRVPTSDLRELYSASLLSGVERWYAHIQCATSIKDRVFPPGSANDPGLAPYLAYVSSKAAACGEARESLKQKEKEEPKKKPKRASGRLSKGVSRFWEDPTDQTDKGASTVVRRRDVHVRDVPVHKNKVPKSRTIALEEQTRKPKSTGESKQERRSRERTGSTGDPVPSPAVTPGTDLSNNSDLTKPQASVVLELPAAPTLKKRAVKSPYFNLPSPSPSPKKPRPARGVVSSLPFPPLSAPCFGLVQEELAADPFRLLVAVTFLIRTPGRTAIPVFRALVARFPTPDALAAADPAEIVSAIRHLGLAAVRCAAVQRYARTWVARPPVRSVRYGVKNYPEPGDGRDVRAGAEYGPEDVRGAGAEAGVPVWVPEGAADESARSAWEIGHLTQGRYAIDSWRIFCRDVLLGRAEDWMGKGREATFQPEWMRVLPADKELRACLRWMWMREGWEWDPVSGERSVLREEMRKAVDEGRVGYDDGGSLVIIERDSDRARSGL